MDDNFGGWMKILSFVFLLTFYALAQFGGNSAPRWGGNSAPAWGGNPVDDAPACEWIVTSTDDAGAGTLRQMIADASAGDTICFDESLAGMEIVIGSALVIEKDLSIFGFGTNHVIISADSGSRVFELSGAGASVIFRGLRITKGKHLSGTGTRLGGGITGSLSGTMTLVLIDSCIIDSCNIAGGGVFTWGAGAYFGSITNVVVQNSIIRNNTANFSSGVVANSGEGGGIYTASSVTNFTIQQSAIVGNRCVAGGTVSTGGGNLDLDSQNNKIVNCTISGGSTHRTGAGGILISAGSANIIDFCTISNNTASTFGCGGLKGMNGTADTLRNSIIANNTGGSANDASGTLTYAAENCIEVLTGLTITTDGGGNLNTDPGLAALAFDGETWIHAIDSGDPVYNVGDCAIGTGGDVDQRGISRPQSTECDMGAYEVE